MVIRLIRSQPLWLALILASGFAGFASAGAEYQITTATFDSAGGAGSNGLYAHRAALGVLAGEGTSRAGEIRHGYIAQLTQLREVRMNAPAGSSDEETRITLFAEAVLDDGTLLNLTATDFSWRVSSGPQTTISAEGILEIPSVFTHGSLTVQARYGSLAGEITIGILNTNYDDFGGYRGDGLPDDWQVAFFKLDSLEAAPNADPDGDGLDNAGEFAAGTNPTVSDSDFDRIIDGKDLDPALAPPVERSGGSYILIPEVFDAGGGYSVGSPYTQIATIGFIGGFGTARFADLEHGYAPMIGRPDPNLFRPELQISVEDSPDPVLAGGALSYIISVSNRGTAPATQVIVSNLLPQEVLFVSAGSDLGSWTGAGPVVGQLDSLAVGGRWSSTILVTPLMPGTITNRTTVQAAESDTNALNDTAIQITAVLRPPGTEPRVFGLSAFGLVDGRFSLRVDGRAGEAIRIDRSADLIFWSPVTTNAFQQSSSFDFTDMEPLVPRRFFRGVLLP